MKIDLGDQVKTKSVGQLLVGETFMYGNTGDLYLKATIESIFLTNKKEDGCAVVCLSDNKIKVWDKDIQVLPFKTKVVKDN